MKNVTGFDITSLSSFTYFLSIRNEGSDICIYESVACYNREEDATKSSTAKYEMFICGFCLLGVAATLDFLLAAKKRRPLLVFTPSNFHASWPSGYYTIVVPIFGILHAQRTHFSRPSLTWPGFFLLTTLQRVNAYHYVFDFFHPGLFRRV